MAVKGVMIDFDFAAMNGAELLATKLRGFLEELDHIPFDEAVEARYFAGSDYLSAITEYFLSIKTKKTPQKAARDFDELFRAELGRVIPKAAAKTGFVNFVKTLSDRGLKVLIATRAALEPLQEAFAPVLGENVSLYHDETLDYGFFMRDSLRLMCIEMKIRPANILTITGSGFGVKAAVRSGFFSMAVMNPRVAYQDFTGCSEIVRSLDANAARKALEVLRVS